MPHSQRPASPETLSGISSSASSRALAALRATRSRAFRGFTLVELIVVITILAILATIGFLALSGYTSDAGRSSVLSNLRTVEKGLSVTATTAGSFPAPTGGVPVTFSGGTAWVQWTAGKTVMAEIWMDEPPKDPAGNAEFEYSVTANGLEFQVGSAYLAGTAHAPAPGIPSALAVDSVPVPKAAVSGNYNGLFVPVNAAGTNFLVPAPSIILSDFSVPELKSAPAPGPSFVADGLPGTPASWSGKVAGLSQTGIAFPAAKTAAYSSATEAFPATSTGVAALAETLAQAYSGTSLAALPKVSAVVKASAAGDSSGLASAVAGAGVSSLGRNLAPAVAALAGDVPAGGSSGGSSGTPATPVDGACGTPNGQTLVSAPSENLCSPGTPSAVADGTSWTWSCAGTDGGATASCSAAKPAATIIGNDDSGRGWSDGAYAVSCSGYLNAPAGYSYSGSTGNGVYQIDPDGAGGFAAFKAYCDMTTDGGGWTRFVKYRDSIDRSSVCVAKSTAVSCSGYKIGLNGEYSEILLNGCVDGAKTTILVDIPQVIKDAWVSYEGVDGVTPGSGAFRSCGSTVSRKEGGTWHYGHERNPSATEFETLHFASSCINSWIDSWSYAKWGAIDAGNSDRSYWGTVNGTDHSRSWGDTYYDDWICAYVR